MKDHAVKVPGELMQQIQEAAAKEGISPLAWIQRCFKMGFIMQSISESPTTKIVIQKDGEDDKELLWS